MEKHKHFLFSNSNNKTFKTVATFAQQVTVNIGLLLYMCMLHIFLY